MANDLWQAFVQITGAANAALLGITLIFSPRLHKTRSRHKLGLALLAYGYLLATFTAIDQGWLPPSWWILLGDGVIVLLAAALFLGYMCGALGSPPPPRAIYLAPLVIVVPAVIAESFIFTGPAIEIVIACQILFSTVTTAMYFRGARLLASRPRHLGFLLIGLWTLHGFQVLRMALPDIGWLFDSVPLAGAGLMLVLTVLVLTDSRTLRVLARPGTPRTTPPLRADTLDTYMREQRPHLDPALTLDRLAAALGLSGRDLSSLLRDYAGRSFYDFVNHHRVAEAKRFLTDPTEQRTSIEAIGLMAGFRARSTFYEAFRRETGQTPAEFRTRHR